jgi:glycerophosphoryl diester phosphodiesterase
MGPPSTPLLPIRFAHRGARAHAPENTLEAFVLACRMGATGLESDVWLTADGVAVLDHDGVVGRGRRGEPIRRVARDQLPPHIPTLADLYGACGTGLELSLDVKDPGAVEEVVRVAGSFGEEALHRLWLCDTDPVRLATWRRIDPRVRLVGSIARRRVLDDPRCDPARLAAEGIDVLNLRGDTWTPRLVAATRDAGLLAFAWRVQTGVQARLLLRWGIDGLYSDHVDRLRSWQAP